MSNANVGRKKPNAFDGIFTGLQTILLSLLDFISHSDKLYLGVVDIESRTRASRCIPQLAQLLEIAWLNLEGEEDLYSKNHLVWLVSLVAVTELARDNLLNFYGGALLLLRALTELMQVLDIPEHRWQDEAHGIQLLLDEHSAELKERPCDMELTQTAEVGLPREASKALGLWPQRRIGGRNAAMLTTAMFLPGGFTLTATIIGTAILVSKGREELSRQNEEKSPEKVLEQRCFQKAEHLLKRKIAPIRITNTLVQDDFPDEIKLCLFYENDLLELVPVGGFNGPGVGYCPKGGEMALRPPFSENGTMFKLKAMRPRRFLNEALITIMGVCRGDKLILAHSPINPDTIIVRRM